MAMETVSAAGGNIEVMLLQQVGSDPFTPTLERAAQIGEVARRIARFISEARATLDIAIYDFQLRDDAAEIMTDALRERAKNNVVIRIVYDAATELGDDTVSTASPANLEADRNPLGTESFVRSFSDIAQIKGITGYRALMHKQIHSARWQFCGSSGRHRLVELYQQLLGIAGEQSFVPTFATPGVLLLQSLYRPSLNGKDCRKFSRSRCGYRSRCRSTGDGRVCASCRKPAELR